MNITLFHGAVGLVVALAACFGAVALGDAFRGWLADRFTVSLRHGLHRRWDRPGQMVRTDDGREVAILQLVRDKDAGDMAVIQSYGEDEQELWPPEWVSPAILSPLPAHAEEAA